MLSVGLAPGLTNLLAKALHQRRCDIMDADAMDAADAIELVVLLGAGEQHGAAATDWSYEHLGRHYVDPGSGQRVA